MRLLLPLLFIAFMLTSCKGQVYSSKDVDRAAEFPGGNKNYANYLEGNFSWVQSQLTIEGVVLISFVVRSNGNITDVKVVKSLCETCDSEAIRLIKMMPDWTPAILNNKKVSSQVVLPVNFRL